MWFAYLPDRANRVIMSDNQAPGTLDSGSDGSLSLRPLLLPGRSPRLPMQLEPSVELRLAVELVEGKKGERPG